MRAVLEKIRNACGETLVETLVAVLICGIAAALLMSAIGTASMLNQSARTTTRQVDLQAANAARFHGYLEDDVQADFSTGTLKVTDKDAPAYTETIDGADIEVYGGPLIVSYGLAEGGE